MKVHGRYHEQGYAQLEDFLAKEVASAFFNQLQSDLREARIPIESFAQDSKLLNKSAIEIYGYRYKPMVSFLWGMTPAICELTGRDLLPTYNLLRIYQAGDICRVHSDRRACEHSLSLTLAYSDGKTWDFQVGSAPVAKPLPFADDFDDEPFSTIRMKPGDGVLYKGVEYRHGRITPNPNRWSAHMFLHWIDRDGPYLDTAFDGKADVSDPASR